MIQRPFFSIVMACYQVEDYLNEAVKSIESQSLPLREYVQLILVDDGSTDQTGKIADAWAEKYPENITVVHQPNGGVAAARNAGLKLIRGQYINFLDADDMFSLDTLEHVYDFIISTENTGENVDVYAIPLFFFEAQEGPHVLNYRFDKGNRIIDLDAEINAAHLFTNASFIRSEAIGDQRFDTRLQISEDACFLQPILMKKRKLGVISKAKYMYRRRMGENVSAIQGSTLKRSWYLETPKVFYLELAERAKSEYGEIPRFIQFTWMYDMQWRFRMRHVPKGVLTEEEQQLYWNILMQTLHLIDPDIIIKQRHLTYLQKEYLYRLRIESETPEKRKRYWNRWQNILLTATTAIKQEFVSSRDQCVEIECSYFEPVDVNESDPALSLCLVNDKKKRYLPTFVERKNFDYCIDRPFVKRKGLVFQIPLEDFNCEKGKLVYELTRNNKRVKYIVQNQTFSPYNFAFKQLYVCMDKILLKATHVGFLWEKSTRFKAIKQEFMLYGEFLHLGFKAGIRPVSMRIAVHAVKLLHRKPIWLVSDREDCAGDNGEAMFLYLNKHRKNIASYFVLSPSSADYQRLKKIGKVIPYQSYRHKLLLLASDCNLISTGTRASENPYANGYAPYADMMAKIKYVFLQHGVLRNDLSAWGNRYIKNFSGFITSASKEKASIVNGDYFYREDQVWDTGLARFDRLYHDEQHMVTIMPTWRKYLAERPECFEESRYFQAWMAVLKDKRLHEALSRCGYTLQLVMHPNMREFYGHFDGLPHVKIVDENAIYRDIVAQTNLLITDFSSIIFDVAYLMKPIISYQFDSEEFFSGEHTTKPGYFDEQLDGLGPVFTEHEALIAGIVSCLARDCKLEEKYARRIKRFFSHIDQKNCERIYQNVMQVIQEKG